MTVMTPQFSAVRTLPELLAFRVAQSPQGEAYREFNASTGEWVSTSWAAFSERVTHWRRALFALGLPAHSSIQFCCPMA